MIFSYKSIRGMASKGDYMNGDDDDDDQNKKTKTKTTTTNKKVSMYF